VLLLLDGVRQVDHTRPSAGTTVGTFEVALAGEGVEITADGGDIDIKRTGELPGPDVARQVELAEDVAPSLIGPHGRAAPSFRLQIALFRAPSANLDALSRMG
jgi:hypothetical protein